MSLEGYAVVLFIHCLICVPCPTDTVVGGIETLHICAVRADRAGLDLVLSNGIVAGRGGLDIHTLSMPAIVVVGVVTVYAVSLGSDETLLAGDLAATVRGHHGIQIARRSAGRGMWGVVGLVAFLSKACMRSVRAGMGGCRTRRLEVGEPLSRAGAVLPRGLLLMAA